MSSVLWASAAVAASTTLLIEYAAKPWLEVRKDRILEEHRRRRSVQQTLREFRGAAGGLRAVASWESVLHPDFLESNANVVPTLVHKLCLELDLWELKLEGWQASAGVINAVSTNVKLGNIPLPSAALEELDRARTWVYALALLREIPRWRFLRRTFMRLKLESLPVPRMNPVEHSGACSSRHGPLAGH